MFSHMSHAADHRGSFACNYHVQQYTAHVAHAGHASTMHIPERTAAINGTHAGGTKLDLMRLHKY